MRLQNPLSALSSSLEMGILYVLCGADESFTAPLIHRLLPEEGSLPGVRYALPGLVDQGIVLERKLGRISTFALNRDHVLAGLLMDMAQSKAVLLGRIGETVASWRMSPTVVTLFGSAARGDMRSDSDIDLFLLFPDGMVDGSVEDDVASLASMVASWTGNDARPLVYTHDEVEDNPLFRGIVDEGIHIFGDRRALVRQMRLKRDAA
ncbi:hypothetical protein CVV67_06075 [Arthrobacter stackebrandtii]|nr:hypothetical protein CVV67_06075 [Arthrobacter stackebrandtii]